VGARGTPPDAGALGWLPIAGGILGAVAGAAGLVAGIRLEVLAPVVAWGTLLVLSGAIHLDGFLDWCDGIFAAATPERRLEIMRDPRHGTFALAGLAVLALVAVRSLDQLAPQQLPAVLAYAAIAGRLAAVANAWEIPYASGGSTPDAFARRPPLVPIVAAIVIAGALAWSLGIASLLLLPPAIGAGLVIARWSRGRLGGAISGDVYGAIVTIVEVAVMALVPLAQQLVVR
jgi:adenosylcobinamide-GDP ribazoletransferase